jgi:hypothetical protein
MIKFYLKYVFASVFIGYMAGIDFLTISTSDSDLSDYYMYENDQITPEDSYDARSYWPDSTDDLNDDLPSMILEYPPVIGISMLPGDTLVDV